MVSVKLTLEEIAVREPADETAIAIIDLPKKADCSSNKVLELVAEPEGNAELVKAHLDVEQYIASIDQVLIEHGYITPVLDDDGDKSFATT